MVFFLEGISVNKLLFWGLLNARKKNKLLRKCMSTCKFIIEYFINIKKLRILEIINHFHLLEMEKKKSRDRYIN